MLVLGTDWETTIEEPIDPTKMRITEIGAILWCTEQNKPLEIYSQSVWGDEYVFHPLMQQITGMTEAEHREYGKDPKTCIGKYLSMTKKAAYIIAHNGNGFDKPVLWNECRRHGLEFPEQPWIDTTSDIAYPKEIETRKLKFLGPEHGFLNPFAHRAIFDTLTMLKIMAQYKFEEIVARSKMPDVTVRAVVAKPFGPTAQKGEKEVALAKARGYRFDGATKTWLKRIKESEYADEAAASQFQVVIIKDLKNAGNN